MDANLLYFFKQSLFILYLCLFVVKHYMGIPRSYYYFYKNIIVSL